MTFTLKVMTGRSDAASPATPTYRPVEGAAAAAVLRKIAECEEDYHAEGDCQEILKDFDTAFLQYLLEEKAFSANVEAVVSKARRFLNTIKARVNIRSREGELDYLTHLGGAWVGFEIISPWQKLQFFTQWIERAGTYPPIPSNRFSNMRYPQDTLVQARNALGGLEFIPANRIGTERIESITGLRTPKLIAAQYPFASRSAEMVLRTAYYEEGAIIDLTNNADREDVYYPTTVDEIKEYPSLSITYKGEGDGGVQLYMLTDRSSGSIRMLKRYHFKEWPDCEPLGDAEKLEKLAERIDAFDAQTVIIHCRAGIGRTGTLLAAYFTLHRLKAHLINPDNVRSDVFNTVLYLRIQRGPDCVQTPEQYDDVLKFALNRLEKQKREAGK